MQNRNDVCWLEMNKQLVENNVFSEFYFSLFIVHGRIMIIF